MNLEEERIKKTLVLSEEQLQRNEVRNNAERISELIEKNCIEILPSGKQRVYQPGDLFASVDGEIFIMSDSVQYINLSEDCKMLVYSAGKVHKNSRMKSLRSSIWKKNNNTWKMIFHQGTGFVEP